MGLALQYVVDQPAQGLRDVGDRAAAMPTDAEANGLIGIDQAAGDGNVAQRPLADPARLDIRGSLSCGRDVSIDVGCVFEGVKGQGITQNFKTCVYMVEGKAMPFAVSFLLLRGSPCKGLGHLVQLVRGAIQDIHKLELASSRDYLFIH